MEYEKKINRKGRSVYKFAEGGISEEKHFYIITNEEVGGSWSHPCKHSQNGTTPLAIKAVNEGGHNVTLVCLECVLEAAEQLRKDNEI